AHAGLARTEREMPLAGESIGSLAVPGVLGVLGCSLQKVGVVRESWIEQHRGVWGRADARCGVEVAEHVAIVHPEICLRQLIELRVVDLLEICLAIIAEEE